MVTGGDREEQRARPRGVRLHHEQPTCDRAVTETLGRAEPAAEIGSLPIRDVDAELLHQPSGQEPPQAAQGPARAGQRGAAGPLRQASPNRALTTLNGLIAREGRIRALD